MQNQELTVQPTSKSLPIGNAVFPVALSSDERKWYQRIKLKILASNREYYCSWWLRLDYESVEENLTTGKVNYWLTKLVKKGYLTKKASKLYTIYSLTDVVA